MIKCIIIDDEPLALDLLEDFIKKVPFLNLIKKFRSAFDAIDLIQKNEVDLMFLDIQMPDITGIQFMKSIKNKPMVIFTTAYEKYALEGYDLDVVDYLLKPIPFDRFLKAVNKAYEYFNLRKVQEQTPNTETLPSQNEKAGSTPDFIFVRADYQTVKISFNDIKYIEGLKDYIKIYLFSKDKPILTLLSLKAIEEKLPSSEFIRVHRSYIVAVNKIDSIRKNRLWISNKEIPIGDIYQDNLDKFVKDRNV
jgi:two-component system, LytTR family, response regulator